MSNPQTPLSPFLQYRPQLTSVLSITHRITGVLLCAGAVLLSVWLAALAAGSGVYEVLYGHVTAWYGRLVIFGFVFALYYHLCNGIRHLCWDLGWGLEITTAYRSGYAVLVFTLLLTMITFRVASIV